MADQRLQADRVRSWCEQADVTLTEMMESFQARHGFPPGTNLVALATDESHQATDGLVELTPIPSDLTTMYWVIDEVSLPDVDSGYFSAAARFDGASSDDHDRHVASASSIAPGWTTRRPPPTRSARGGRQ